jgi:flavin-dependent dehydrogenase
VVNEESPTTADIEDVDVVIVGARLAGTATAVPLARAGLRVVVIDKARFPSDTMSTHAMVPSAVQELLLMGALDRVLALNPSRPRYLDVADGGLFFRERYQEHMGIDYALCIPRDQLDIQLVETARAAGAEIREGCGFNNVVWRDGRPVGITYTHQGQEHEIHARVVIGADGRKSKVAAELGVWEPYRGSKNLRGFAFRYLDDPAGPEGQDAYGIYRAAGNVALVLPSCPAGRAVVVHMCDARDIPRFRADPEGVWQEKLDRDPVLKARLEGATNLSSVRTTDDLSSFYRRSSGPGWALVGDAGHFKDPVTGNGQRDALKHGRLLGQAIARSIHDPQRLDAELKEWEHQRDRDTLSTYHWGNRETHPRDTSALVRAVLSTFTDNDDRRPDFSDTFNRVRKIEHVLGPRRLLRGLVTAWREPGADRRAILAEPRRELPLELAIRRHRWFGGFRSTRTYATENPGWTLGKNPGAPSYRPAAVRRDEPAPIAKGA